MITCLAIVSSSKPILGNWEKQTRSSPFFSPSHSEQIYIFFAPVGKIFLYYQDEHLS